MSEKEQEPAKSKGRGWHGDSEAHAQIGRKGGLANAAIPGRMAEIGRKGGQVTSENREHMVELGRKGGSTKRAKAQEEDA